MQHGIELSRKTMADWVLKCAEALAPFCLLLRQIQLKQPVIHGDETTVKVLKEDKSTCYMWVYCVRHDVAREVVLQANGSGQDHLYHQVNLRA